MSGQEERPDKRPFLTVCMHLCAFTCTASFMHFEAVSRLCSPGPSCPEFSALTASSSSQRLLRRRFPARVKGRAAGRVSPELVEVTAVRAVCSRCATESGCPFDEVPGCTKLWERDSLCVWTGGNRPCMCEVPASACQCMVRALPPVVLCGLRAMLLPVAPALAAPAAGRSRGHRTGLAWPCHLIALSLRTLLCSNRDSGTLLSRVSLNKRESEVKSLVQKALSKCWQLLPSAPLPPKVTDPGEKDPGRAISW